MCFVFAPYLWIKPHSDTKLKAAFRIHKSSLDQVVCRFELEVFRVIWFSQYVLSDSEQNLIMHQPPYVIKHQKQNTLRAAAATSFELGRNMPGSISRRSSCRFSWALSRSVADIWVGKSRARRSAAAAKSAASVDA
jgi:hypothetical protein